jgi:hypothetical protein
MPLNQIWLRAQSNIPERVAVDDVLRRLAWMHEVERSDPDRDSQVHLGINITTVPGNLQQNIEGFIEVYDVVGSATLSSVNASAKDFVCLGYSINNTSMVVTGTGATTVYQSGAVYTTCWNSALATVGGFSGTTRAHEDTFATTPLALGTGYDVSISTDSHVSAGKGVDQKTQAEATFQSLYKRWMEEAGFSSSSTDIVLNSAYQRIIGMGQSALPLIFAQLRKEGPKPDQWFWALEAITRENPVPREFWTNRRLVAGYWLDWADAHGYTP